MNKLEDEKEKEKEKKRIKKELKKEKKLRKLEKLIHNRYLNLYKQDKNKIIKIILLFLMYKKNQFNKISKKKK